MGSLVGKSPILRMLPSELERMLHLRCLDELFFTWNESKETLRDRLDTIHAQDPHIQITITIDQTINYLDVNIGHLDGDLKIQAAHNLGIEPYALPFVFGHPRHQYSSLPRAALMRAVRCCADVSRFANELEDLRLSFEYNGFEEDFFTDKLQLFLEEFDTVGLKALHCGEAYYDQSLYDRLRENVFNENQPQKRQCSNDFDGKRCLIVGNIHRMDKKIDLILDSG
jgi:hypothetical protein